MRTHRSGLPRPFAVVPIALIIACALLLTPPAIAGITLPSIFGDAMVLQRDRLIPVWGTTDGASTIEVAIGGESRTATPNADGSWRVDLPPMPAGGPHGLACVQEEGVLWEAGWPEIRCALGVGGGA